MPGIKQRFDVTNAQTGGNLKGEILEEISLQEKITGKKRGLQKPRQRIPDSRVVFIMGYEHVIFNGELYYKLTNGNILPSKWLNIYDWFTAGMAPSECRDALAKTVP